MVPRYDDMFEPALFLVCTVTLNADPAVALAGVARVKDTGPRAQPFCRFDHSACTVYPSAVP